MITLICGLPNSGKTTFSKRYGNVLHLDDYGHRISEAVAHADGDVVVEGVFVLGYMRKRILESYSGDGKKVCVWLNASPEECVRRESRGRPNYMIWNCHSVFEPPTYDEGWDEIVVIKGDSDG